MTNEFRNNSRANILANIKDFGPVALVFGSLIFGAYAMLASSPFAREAIVAFFKQ